MRTRVLAATAAMMIALPVAGCGGDDKTNRESSYKPPATSPAEIAEVKANVRSAAVELEACFIDTQDYSKCKDKIAGDATVTEAAAATYTVEGKTKSGTTFTIEKTEGGETERTCNGDGCEGGTW